MERPINIRRTLTLLLTAGLGLVLSACVLRAFPEAHLDRDHPVDSWLLDRKEIDGLSRRIAAATDDARASLGDFREKLVRLNFSCREERARLLCHYQQHTFPREPYLADLLMPLQRRTTHTVEVRAFMQTAARLAFIVCDEVIHEVSNGGDYEPMRSASLARRCSSS